MSDRTFGRKESSLPELNNMTPLVFWDNSITNKLVEKTNLYSV